MASPMTRTSSPGIYRRGTRYVVVLRDSNGRQLKRSTRTMAEARVLRSSLATDIARGELTVESRIGFAEYAERWLTTFAGRTADGIRPHTMENYRRVIQHHAIPFFGSTPLAELRLPDIKQYAAHIASRGVSTNTVRLHVGPVRVLLATAVEDGLLRSNPAAAFRNVYGRRTRAEERPRALAEDELSKLIGEIGEEYQLFVRFLAESGLRIGEAIELRWHDVDLEARTASVARRFFKDGVDAPKSRNGVRTVPIGEPMADALAELQAERGEPEHALVFQTPDGTRTDVHNFRRRIYKPAAKRAGVPWANIHMLRHTCASRLFRAGWSAKHVQQMLGHHSPAFTLATYVHLMPGELGALPLPSTPI